VNILIIDDDALFRGVISRALKAQGHQTVIALDGVDALKTIRHETFDLIITDLFMPNKEGLEVIQEIRALLPVIPILAVSSDGLAGYTSFLKVALAFGANAALRKPFSPEQLLESIKGLQDAAPAVLPAI
jgi:CheY-like chemotaxis protein